MLYGVINSPASVPLLSEAINLLNGAHIGFNSRLGKLVKDSYNAAKLSVGITNDKTEKPFSCDEDYFTSISGLLIHCKEYIWQDSSYCHVTTRSLLKSCGKQVVLNPFSINGKHYYPFCISKTSSHFFDTCILHHRRHYSTQRTISKLEDRANSESDNARVQAQYLEAVVNEDPQYVIRRFESGRYAVNDDVRRIYRTALDLSKRISGQTKATTSNLGIEEGTKDNPVHVVVQPRKGGFARELWSMARFVLGAFIITAFVSSAMFSQIKGGTQHMTRDFRPDSNTKQYTFDDVQGIDEAKEEVREIVEFLHNPSKYKTLGAKLPTGVLLIGAPGTGKTLLAKAIAGEANVPFFFASGSEFDEMFVGVGAARVRKLFEQARRNKPCVVFLDELDAVGGARVSSALHPYSRMTLNQLLVELDGYKELEGVVVIGATNFPESLDKALVRPGRFDTRIDIPMPDIRARHNILKVHAKKVLLADDVNLEVIARGTTGFSGAELANLVNQAALKGSADGSNYVSMSDLEYAKDKIIMGPERKSAVIEKKNKELIAVHEGGHAIVSLYTPGALPIHKATIVPRGSALGMVSFLPEKDELSWTKQQLLAKMDVAMGGRVAEEIIYGTEQVTSGASSDLENATKIAQMMVSKVGMSDVVGPVSHDEEKVSTATKKIIEDEVKRLLKESHDRAYNILKSHTVEHKRLSEALLKYETLTADEVKLVIKSKPLKRTL